MTSEDLNDDFLQYLFNRLNEGYSEYKRNHPDFARFVERELEGKPEPKEKEDDWYKDHCVSCGEWLPYGVDICPECGRINK